MWAWHRSWRPTPPHEVRACNGWQQQQRGRHTWPPPRWCCLTAGSGRAPGSVTPRARPVHRSMARGDVSGRQPEPAGTPAPRARIGA